MCIELNPRGRNPSWARAAEKPSAADGSVESAIGKYQRILPYNIFLSFSPLLALNSPHLKNVRKVGGKSQLEWDVYWIRSIVDYLKLFVTNSSPEEFCPQKVQRSSWDDNFAAPRDIHVRQVRREQRIIRFDG